MRLARLLALLATSLLIAAQTSALVAATTSTKANTYDIHYVAHFQPDRGVVRLEIHLAGDRLPSRVVLRIDPTRHKSFVSKDALATDRDRVTWQPQGKAASLGFDFIVNHERSPQHYDSLMNKDWALLRADKLVPMATVTAPRSLHSHATLELSLPPGWSAATPYSSVKDEGTTYAIDEPSRRFDRPRGWLLVGKIGQRSELIEGTQTVVAAPEGDKTRRQDILAFVNWNLPQLIAIFPSLPKRVLIVTAGDPMWRGGLSGPGSLFLHADRPLISENRTSTLLHELVHVATGIRGDDESDWIVEGIAEFYSVDILRRSGSIGRQRYDETLRRLAAWGRRAPALFGPHSAGAQTARAVTVFKAADTEIRAATSGRASLDDVARRLAERGGEVSLDRLQSIAQEVAGRPVRALERERLDAADR
jgi:hypothetical protein